MKKFFFYALSAAMLIGCAGENLGGALGEPPQADNNKVDTSKIGKLKTQVTKVDVRKPVDEAKYSKIKVPKL